MFYDTFIKLCAEASKKPAEVCRDLDISKSTVSCWKSRKSFPTEVTLQKIATYFSGILGRSISVHDLVDASEEGRIQDVEYGSLTEEEKTVVSALRKMPTDRRKIYISLLATDEGKRE